MQDFIDFENNYRFFTEQKQIDLLNLVTSKIIGQILSNDEIVGLLFDVDAEIAHDILKIMLHGKFITNDDYNEIDTKLIAIYDKEFVEDVKTGVLEERLRFKTNKNKRLISRYEILGIYFSKSLDSKALFGIEECEDETLNNLAKVHKELCFAKKANLLSKKQAEMFENILLSVIDKIDLMKREETNV